MDNLKYLLSFMAPTVARKIFHEPLTEGNRTSESVTSCYFSLEDLWESFNEWSAYGVEVPLMLNEVEAVTQYFVPYLSAIQLFVEPQGLGVKAENYNSPGEPAYSFFEVAAPHFRPPLREKVSILASKFPNLLNYKSSELSRYSWFSVAWYPIYRVPAGSSLKDLDTSFLTFHSLSTKSMSKNQSEFHASTSNSVEGPSKISLPVFGLATYKLRGSTLDFTDTSQLQQIETLSKAAANWLQNLQARHPDYEHFSSRP